jgi:hypothetical protein
MFKHLKIAKKAQIPCILACHLQIDADPDPVYHFDADADPDLFFMRMRIRIPNTGFITNILAEFFLLFIQTKLLLLSLPHFTFLPFRINSPQLSSDC